MAYGVQCAYSVVRIPLTDPTTDVGRPIESLNGQSIASVAAVSYPPGMDASFRLGSGDAIPIGPQLGPVDIDPPHNAGFKIVIPSAQAGELVMLIGFWQACPPMIP